MKLSFALFPSDAHRHAAGRACAGGPWHDHRAAGGARGDAVDLDGRLAGEVRSVFRKYAAGQVHGGEFAGISRVCRSLPEPAQRAKVEHTDVALKNVRFSYTGEEKDEVLHGIDLTLPEGSFTALVGPCGRRQVDGREADRAILGCDLGRDHGRRRQRQGYAAPSALGIRQLRHAG